MFRSFRTQALDTYVKTLIILSDKLFGSIHFKFKKTKWLWLVNDIVTAMNNDKMFFRSFCLYPSYAVGILNSVEEIHFYVLCSEN